MVLKGNEFTVSEKSTLASIGSEVYKLTHKKTGLKVLYVRNNDNNKVFYAAFKTPPHNNSGAAHILEHSVLCASEKYKVKDLFNELSKGSVNTFLNAMTFSDKTMYPAASTNQKDFFNLMAVYLDAVFNPGIYETPQFFEQEGWNYSINKKSQPLEIKGIVYNEMKGAYAHPERILIKKIDESLFKDTPYEYDNGGVPAAIPSLSYQGLLNYHSKYYTPSNSLLYLYGDLDINFALNIISEAVKNYGKTKPPVITLTPKTDVITELQTEYYPVNSQKKDGAYYGISRICCPHTDFEECMALDILNYILAGHDAAPLKKAVLSSGICGGFSSHYRTSAYFTSFSFIGKNAKENVFPQFEKVINGTIAELISKGIDESLVLGALNKWEFYINEDEHGLRPKGLVYGIAAASAWVYKGDVLEPLNVYEMFDRIKNTKDIFHNLLVKYFSNGKTARTVLLPDANILEKAEADLSNRLEEYKKSLAPPELKLLIQKSRDLDSFRKKPALRREVKKIPIITTAQISPEITKLDYSVNENKVIINHNKKDIEYINLHFNLNTAPLELIPYCGLLKEIMGKTATKSYSPEKLINEINIYTGGLSFSVDVLQNPDGSYIPRLNIKIKALSKNVNKALALVKEAINPVLEPKEIKRIYDELLVKIEGVFATNGHNLAINRASSYIFPAYHFLDLVGGISFYNEIRGKSPEDLISKLYSLMDIIFRKNNLTVGLGLSNSASKIQNYLDWFCSQLSPPVQMEAVSIGLSKIQGEGFIIDGGVCYNAAAFNLYQGLPRYSGKLLAAKSILSLDYLWHEIRNKGGAYGCGASFSRCGNVFLFSYRDPEILKTYDIFYKSFEFLRDCKKNNADFSKYVINAIKPFEKPLNPEERLDNSVKCHMLSITEEMRNIERQEILSANISDINEIGECLCLMAKDRHFCTLGAASKVKASGIFSATASLPAR